MESCQLCYSTDNWGKGGHCTVQLALKQQPAWIALENRSLSPKPRPIVQHAKINKDCVQ